MQPYESVSKSALIVEDCLDLQYAMSASMRHRGYSVKVCSNRDEAIQILRLEAFTVLILDYMMPGMSAEAFLPIIREIYPRMPVILMTANPDAYELSSKLGVSGVIPKPFDLDFLYSALERVEDGRKTKIDREAEQFNQLYALTLERPKTDI